MHVASEDHEYNVTDSEDGKVSSGESQESIGSPYATNIHVHSTYWCWSKCEHWKV
jgi:hypothetical protein